MPTAMSRLPATYNTLPPHIIIIILNIVVVVDDDDNNNTITLPRTEPLRILFCGSDEFSCASLRALHKLQADKPKLIKSIDVLVRPGKPAGRGLRRIATGPLFNLAEELGLAVHKRDTFTGWELPPAGHVRHHETGEVVRHPAAHENSHRQPLNLAVAVSFGLFVPPRVLQGLRFGGLNVHPSMLPDLRGPAPLQHALLRGRPHAGVTLQTLHEKDFDRGSVLAQTPWPGLPIPEGCDVRQLHDMLAEKGAELLVGALERRLFVPPLQQVGWRPTDEDLARGLVRDAPKVTKLDSMVDWACWTWGRDKTLYPDGWTAADLARRFLAVGIKLPREGNTGMWTHAITRQAPQEKRLIFEDVEAIECPESLREVVLTIAQAKLSGPAPWLVEQTRSQRLPAKIQNAVFAEKDSLGTHGAAEFRVPYLMDEHSSVIIPIKVPCRIVDGHVIPAHEKGHLDAIRIKRIKVEGANSKLAAHAMSNFKEPYVTVRDISTMDYSMETVAKLVE
ncbi:putative mitochondrial formyl-methionyl-trna transformylase [Diaporthe ampelina]|uniref:methionyl-tRNA formyltransferase n=1 Tax=Diaporthe ampelina TaxID=1214573 RepID=A0A0G2FGM8_9PEZI|nr:putative mitochondrial formyl-methionyl-trna transformylase [Diaporthe ampelina]